MPPHSDTSLQGFLTSKNKSFY